MRFSILHGVVELSSASYRYILCIRLDLKMIFVSTLESRCDASSFWNLLKLCTLIKLHIKNHYAKIYVIQNWMRMQRPLKGYTWERWEFFSFVILNKFSNSAFPRHFNGIVCILYMNLMPTWMSKKCHIQSVIDVYA